MSDCVWIVHQYASTPDTGMGGRHFYLARELAKLGVKVFVIASGSHHLLRRKVETRDRFLLEDVDGFTMVWVDMPPYNDPHSRQRAINWFLFAWRILKVSKVVSSIPDAILCSSPSPISYIGASRLARKFNARLVFEVRDIWPLTLTELGGYSPRHPFIRLMQWIEDFAYREADLVVSNLKYSIEHMVSRGMDVNKFRWVPNGFSLDEVSEKVSLNADAFLKIPKQKFVVGYAGTLGVANAIDTVIKAAHILAAENDIVFVLVGGGREKPDLDEAVRRLGLTNVVFIEPIPKVEIQSLLSCFDVCYLGLTRDSLFRFGVSPNKLFDYLYSAKPIIYGIDSGRYRPVEQAGAGLNVRAEDPVALAEAVKYLKSLPIIERERMGESGRRLALDSYEYSGLALQLREILFSAGRCHDNS